MCSGDAAAALASEFRADPIALRRGRTPTERPASGRGGGRFVIVLWRGLAGGAGAVSRFVSAGVIRSTFRTVLPWGTIVLNISGTR